MIKYQLNNTKTKYSKTAEESQIAVDWDSCEIFVAELGKMDKTGMRAKIRAL